MDTTIQTSMSLGKGIEILVAAKRAANYRPRYVDSLRRYLTLFAKGRHELPISDITVELVEGWFAERNELLVTRQSNAGRLSALFSFAERRGWMTKNPIRLMERIRLDHKPPQILSVEQARRVVEFVQYRHPRALAFLALALFGGVRPQELEAVTWDNVGNGVVTIDSAASKVRRRRIVHLRENAIEWLAFARELGSLLPFGLHKRVYTLKKAAAHIGLAGWPQDVLRHTCASYWLAVSRDVGSVSKELGNSPAILLTNYQELVSADSAAAFWAIRP